MPTIERDLYTRVPGSAVFMCSSTTHIPPSLMHFVHRVRVLPETVVLLTVITESIPAVPPARRYQVEFLGKGLYRLIVHFGFMDSQSIPAVVALAAREQQLPIEPDQLTYYLGRDSFLATSAGRMGHFSESLFAYLARNAVTADRHFGVPTHQVVEIGLQTDL
jgi:KUP system potassium uptake protein